MKNLKKFLNTHAVYLLQNYCNTHLSSIFLTRQIIYYVTSYILARDSPTRQFLHDFDMYEIMYS